MKRFIDLTMIAYGKGIFDDGKVRATLYNLVFNIEFIDAIYGYEFADDEFDFEGGLGTIIVLNEKGVKFFVDHYGTWAIKADDFRPGNNSILVQEPIECVKKKLGLNMEWVL